ncbi:MAG: hypothetical protein MUP70_11305, partial [Candidatus Aminicenantes bacterium]|nr:hypothetical protein [Candidatus Aminicenantes bacterium]
HEGEALNTILSTALLLIIGYITANIFLNGGILFTLNHPRKKGEKRRLAPLFFQGAGKFFGRFLRLCLYSLILWTGLVVVILVLGLILDPITKGGTNEVLIFALVLVRVIFAVFLFFLIKMITDYARIRIVVEDSRRVFLSLFKAAGFVFRRFFGTLAVYYLFVITAAALFALYCMINGAVKTHALLPILISFIITQVFILSRGWVRIGLQAAQLNYFLNLKPLNPSNQEGRAPEADPAPDANPDSESAPSLHDDAGGRVAEIERRPSGGADGEA